MLESFVGSLTVKPFVKAFKPDSISEAIELARLQEENLSVTTTKSTYKQPYYSPKHLQYVPLLPSNKPPLLLTPQTKTNTTLSLAKYPPKRTKNL